MGWDEIGSDEGRTRLITILREGIHEYAMLGETWKPRLGYQRIVNCRAVIFFQGFFQEITRLGRIHDDGGTNKKSG